MNSDSEARNGLYLWGYFDGRLRQVISDGDVLLLELELDLNWNLVPASYVGNWN